MANPLLPPGRTRPIAAFVAATRRPRRSVPSPVVDANEVDLDNRRRQPSALQGAGISSALLGGQKGMTTLRAHGALAPVAKHLYRPDPTPVEEAPPPDPEPEPDPPLFTGTSTVSFVGNSYTQQFAVVPSMAHYVDATLPGAAVTLGPPPILAGTIANGNDGYYPAMTLAGMALYPAFDQRYESGATGTLDAIDALASVPPGTYDFVVLTSGFNQEDPTAADETVPGSGADTVYLQPVRDIITEIGSRISPAPTCIVRMTHEGYRTNLDVDLTQVQDFLLRQVLGARQLEAEGILVVPEHYVGSRLQYGAFGTVGSGVDTPVPAYATLTHSGSLQPGGRNWGWLNRTQGTVAPFNFNTHFNVLSSIVAAWTWGYMMWGIDPRGDTTFTSPVGLPVPLSNFISPDGSLIYGGHATGVGNVPFDTDFNPGGPPDSELVLDWSLATQLQIQERIVAAIDDWLNGITEFD